MPNKMDEASYYLIPFVFGLAFVVTFLLLLYSCTMSVWEMPTLLCVIFLAVGLIFQPWHLFPAKAALSQDDAGAEWPKITAIICTTGFLCSSGCLTWIRVRRKRGPY